MATTAETIDEHFRQYGWSFQRKEGERDWLTGFRGDVAAFRVAVRLTDNWIYFTIIPFVLGPRRPECAARLYYHLLRLNRDITMAKFALDSEDDVLLTVELPTENLDYSEFSDALAVLAHFADDSYLELLNLAQVPGAPSRYDPKPPAPAPEVTAA